MSSAIFSVFCWFESLPRGVNSSYVLGCSTRSTFHETFTVKKELNSLLSKFQKNVTEINQMRHPSNDKSKGWMIDISGASETRQRIVLDHAIRTHTQLAG